MAAARVRPLQNICFVLNVEAPEFQARRFHAATTHLEKLLRFELCERSPWPLDGTPLINVLFGPSRSSPGYNRVSKQFSEVDSPRFNLEQFLAMPGPQRDDATMKRVEKALLNASQACAADPKPLRRAVASIRERDYQGFVPWPDGPTPHPGGKYVAQTGYCVSRDSPHAIGARLSTSDGRELQTVVVPPKVAQVNPFFNGFQKSKWKDDTFCFCNKANRSLFDVHFEALQADRVSSPPKTQSRSTLAAMSSPSLGGPVRPAGKARGKKAGLATLSDRCHQTGLEFLTAIVKGDLSSARDMLSIHCQKQLASRKLKLLLKDFFASADPNVNRGTTFEMVAPHLYVNVEDSLDTAFLADQWPSVAAQTSIDNIVAVLEMGCEPIAREPLYALVDREGKLWLRP